jgi:hypothetical protein
VRKLFFSHPAESWHRLPPHSNSGRVHRFCARRAGAALRCPTRNRAGHGASNPGYYWLEGALIGGTAAGLLLSTFVYYGCTHDDSSASRPCWDNALLGAGFGFAGGATLGGLLGGLIPKSDEPPVDSLTSH